MECAGNGRARASRRTSISQPWLHEAVGTGAWRGVRLRDAARRGRRRATARSRSSSPASTAGSRAASSRTTSAASRSSEALRDEVLLAYELNGAPLPPQHGFPLRLLVPGWYGMTSVKWLDADRRRRPSRSTATRWRKRYRLQRDEDDEGEPVTRMRAARADGPAGDPGLHDRASGSLEPGRACCAGRAWSGWAPVDGGRGERRRRRDVGAGARSSTTPLGRGPGAAGRSSGTRRRGEHELCVPRARRRRQRQPLERAWNVGGYANNAVQRASSTFLRRRARPVGSAGR